MSTTPGKTYKRPTVIGNIKSIMALPCVTPPELWVSTFADAALQAYFSYLSPDPREIYHNLRGNSLICDLKGAALDIPAVPPEADSSATRFFFRALEFIEWQSWFVFLAAIVDQGLLQWTSDVMRFSCPEKQMSPFAGGGMYWFGGLDKNGQWQTADYYMNDGSVYSPATPSRIKIKPNHGGYVAANASWKKAHVDSSGSAGGRSINLTTGVVYDHHTTEVGLVRTKLNQVTAKIHNYSTDVVEVACQWSGAGGQTEPGTLLILDGGSCSLFAEL